MIAILYRIGNIDTALTLANQLFKLNSPEKYKNDLLVDGCASQLLSIKNHSISSQYVIFEFEKLSICVIFSLINKLNNSFDEIILSKN